MIRSFQSIFLNGNCHVKWDFSLNLHIRYVWRICNFYVHFALLGFTRNDSLLLFLLLLLPLLHISHFDFLFYLLLGILRKTKSFILHAIKFFHSSSISSLFFYLLTIQMFYSKAFRERSQEAFTLSF